MGANHLATVHDGAAAILGALAARMMAVEIVEPLVRQARTNLDRAGWGANVALVDGDGGFGFAQFAPYDAISVAAAAPEIPAALLAQLNDPGRLVELRARAVCAKALTKGGLSCTI